MKQERERIGKSAIIDDLASSKYAISKDVQKRNGIYRLRKFNSPSREGKEHELDS